MPTTKAAPFLLLLLLSFPTRPGRAAAGLPDPTPARWPEQFHALVYMNLTTTGKLVINDLWYDWPNGRNFNIMQRQLSSVLYDLEWANGTSFYYTLGPGGSCRQLRFPVGIVRPDFLQEGSTYLGRVVNDGFLCDLWVKDDFIWYYEDVTAKRPVRWDFFDGITMHVMTFEEGAVLDDPHWQAPTYCFADAGDVEEAADGGGGGGAPRGEEGEEEAELGRFAEVHRRFSFLNHKGIPAHLCQPLQLGGFGKGRL